MSLLPRDRSRDILTSLDKYPSIQITPFSSQTAIFRFRSFQGYPREGKYEGQYPSSTWKGELKLPFRRESKLMIDLHE
jgi:hypothetical protein